MRKFLSLSWRIIPWLILLISCQNTLELRVRTAGSSTPQNDREQVIFDYYKALQDKRYEDAYQLRAWHLVPVPITLQYFKQIHSENHHSLPTTISIGEGRESRLSDTARCGYNYTVYTAYPGSLVLRSGEITMHSKPGEPEICLIGYNSAFGSIP
ncbi:MAG: hypothetical protein F6K16_36020 [Symploca sp. SIO2B6]|nr:hypothetical protein [Symploca sp. SIO2B6]